MSLSLLQSPFEVSPIALMCCQVHLINRDVNRISFDFAISLPNTFVGDSQILALRIHAGVPEVDSLEQSIAEGVVRYAAGVVH